MPAQVTPPSCVQHTIAAMLNVDLVWFNAGGGHRAAAQALEQSIHAQGRPWRVRKVNFTEVIDPDARWRRTVRLEPEELYNKRLASGFTLGLSTELRWLQRGIRWSHPLLVERLARHWRATTPDLVVSLIPNFNRAMHDALALACPGVPFATVLTDMADHPPAFWVEPGTGQHVIAGTAHAVAQALMVGVPAPQVHRVQGMMLRPAFHLPPPPDFDRARERLALGLPADAPVGLVLFGGAGSRAMKRIATALPDVPLILMCGRNEALASELRAAPAAAPRVVVGYTADVPHWMRLADFFVGKPGPGSLSEAVQLGLPVIVTRNAWTMPQERWNTEWVEQQGVGLVLKGFGEIAPAVRRLLAELPAWRARVGRVENRAVAQVPEVLADILARLPQSADACRLASSH